MSKKTSISLVFHRGVHPISARLMFAMAQSATTAQPVKLFELHTVGVRLPYSPGPIRSGRAAQTLYRTFRTRLVESAVLMDFTTLDTALNAFDT